MSWELFEKHWEMAFAILGIVWGIRQGIKRKQADKKHQRFLDTHFRFLETHLRFLEQLETAELAILNGKQAGGSSLPEEPQSG